MTPQSNQIHSADAARLSRLDAAVADLQSRLAAKLAERAAVAERWGRSEGLCVRATPDMMRRSLAMKEARNG